MILEDTDIFENKLKLYMIALYSGIAIGIKITQIFFIIPLLLYMLYLNRKSFSKLKIWNIGICFILAILPYMVYLIDNYFQTGSILFPYYNNILKSKYFPEISWVDERFTLSGMWNYMFWPVIEGFSRRSYGDDHIYIDPFFGITYICTLLYFLYSLLSKKRGRIFELSIISIVIYAIWITIMEGYLRYGIFVGVLFSIITLSLFAEFIKTKRINISSELKKIFFSILVVYEISICSYLVCEFCDFENGKMIFKDTDKQEYKIAIDGVWGAPEDCVGFVSLVREDGTPIYNLYKDYFSDVPEVFTLWEDKIKNNDIYTIIDYYGGKIEEHDRVKSLKEDGFEIEGLVDVYTAEDIPYVNTRSVWLLVKLEYKD